MKPLHIQHAVREDSLSDFSVLTYANSGQRRKVLECMKGRKLSFPGDARAEPKIKPQVCLYDRLKAVPLKAIMRLLTAGASREANPWTFQPQWVQNKLSAKHKGGEWQLIAEVTFSVEEALCRVSVHATIADQVKRKLDDSLEFIAFGKRDGAPAGPVPSNSFTDVKNPAVRYAMNELKSAPLPFRVHVKQLPEQPPQTEERREAKRSLRATPTDPEDRQERNRTRLEGDVSYTGDSLPSHAMETS
eukprot:6479825-Amphidinium_carterae.1